MKKQTLAMLERHDQNYVGHLKDSVLSHISDTCFSGRGQLEVKFTNYVQYQALEIKGTRRNNKL